MRSTSIPVKAMLLALTTTTIILDTAGAATLAYWRFEEGPVNTKVDDVPNAMLDSSGSGNHLRTFNDDTGSFYRDDNNFSRATVIPQTSAANNLYLDFDPFGVDGSPANQDVYTDGKPLNTADLNQFTIEAYVKVEDLSRFQTIVGKDGDPIPGDGHPPIALRLRDDNDRFSIAVVDDTVNLRIVDALAPAMLDQWYWLAATSDGSTLSLFIKGPGDTDYVLQGAVGISGGMIASNAVWTVGRGIWDGSLADWANLFIDEIRISDAVLSSDLFLGSQPIPEPASLSVLLVSGLILLRKR